MADRAKVTSLEAIEDFRARLIVYREKSNRILDAVSDDVTRTRIWLQGDRIEFWRNEIRRRGRELEQRQQELFSAQLSGMRDSSFMQQAAVRKCREAIREAETHLDCVKQWERGYDQRVEAPARQVEKLRHIIGKDLGGAVAYLAEAIKILAAYAEQSPTGTIPPLPPVPEKETTPGGES
ncbi:MAG: hypothetical protein HOP33_19840 [Verrucomicrobia bacterium]|nr:hypothetical protein [Verrucomicrobiota bacterium]